MKKICFIVFILIGCFMLKTNQTIAQANQPVQDGPVPYNLLKNPNFLDGLNGWSSSFSSGFPLFTQTMLNIQNDFGPPRKAVVMQKNASIWQYLDFPVEYGDTIKLVIMYRGNSGGPGNVTGSVSLRYYSLEGIHELSSAGFGLGETFGMNLQIREAVYVINDMDARKIKIQVDAVVNNNSNPAYNLEVSTVYAGLYKLGHNESSYLSDGAGTVGNGNGAGGSSQWTDNSATRISYANQVAIGGDKFYNDNDYKLSVNGKMVAEELLIELRSTWPDYVFDSSYRLRPLAETEAFYRKYRHLPGIPSEKQIKSKGGVEIGELNRKLLEKVEELTIHLVELEKKYNALKQEVKSRNRFKKQ